MTAALLGPQIAACHPAAADVNTRWGGRAGRGVEAGPEEVRLINGCRQRHKRAKGKEKRATTQLLKRIMCDHRKWMQPPEMFFFFSPSLFTPPPPSLSRPPPLPPPPPPFSPLRFSPPSKEGIKKCAATPLWLPDNNPPPLLCCPALSFSLTLFLFYRHQNLVSQRSFNFIFEA